MLPIKASRRTVLALLFFIQEILTSKKLSVELQRARSAAEASIETKLVSITKACLHFVNLKAQRLAATDVTHLSAGSQALVRALTRLMNTAEFVVIVQMLLGYNVAEVSPAICAFIRTQGLMATLLDLGHDYRSARRTAGVRQACSQAASRPGHNVLVGLSFQHIDHDRQQVETLACSSTSKSCGRLLCRGRGGSAVQHPHVCPGHGGEKHEHDLQPPSSCLDNGSFVSSPFLLGSILQTNVY